MYVWIDVIEIREGQSVNVSVIGGYGDVVVLRVGWVIEQDQRCIMKHYVSNHSPTT